MGEAEVTAFLNHLAVERHVAAPTQNQALSAILFLYREVLGRELPWLDGVQRPTRPPQLPVVLTRPRREESFRSAGWRRRVMSAASRAMSSPASKQTGRMLALPAGIEQVRDRVTARHEPIGDERPVAVRGVALGAHDADPVPPGCKRGRCGLEFFGLHVLGI
jgi:hypothetical protein